MSLLPLRPITLYSRWTHTTSSPAVIVPVRRVLKKCRYTDLRADTAIRTGIILQQAISIQVYLQDDLEYIPFNEWRLLKHDEGETDGYFSFEIGGSNNSIVFLGETSHEFREGLLSDVAAQEVAFINAQRPNALRISDFQDNVTFAPSVRTAHWLLRGGT